MNWKGHILLYCAASLACAPAISAAESQPQQIESRLETQTASVVAGSDGIVLAVIGEKSEKFHIYSITGQLVKAIEVGAGGSERVELPRGCYIVKCSRWSKKVMVR